jgi:hypothetical protein
VLPVHQLVSLLTIGPGRLQEEVISINGLSLAFRVITLFPVARWRASETSFKCSYEARNMLIANCVGNFFHAHVTAL